MNIYLAAPLFNGSERLHNLHLENYLKLLGHTNIILPQREALKRQDPVTKEFDLKAIAKDCQEAARNPENIYVGCVDGPDADSGTAIEYAIAIERTSRAIIYRTDFRTVLEKELGINGMFNLEGTEMIYFPCFFTEYSDVEPYYRQLAKKISEKIQLIERK